jgi:hypothetical protein
MKANGIAKVKLKFSHSKIELMTRSIEACPHLIIEESKEKMKKS